MAKLQLSGVGKRFGEVAAVSGVDLALAAGEFVSLLGPSGCGKTTTLRMIAGFILPSEGSISLDGAVLSTAGGAVPPEKRRMSMIFQSYAIWPNMTVAENVAFGLKLRKLSRAEIAAKLDRILGIVHLDRLKDRYPAELSGGQQQRVALARAMVIEPEVLLLDEPLSNLDANLREEMRFEIRRLHDAFRITTVYVTHDQAEAMVTSDRIVVMNQGRIEQVADPFALYNRPLTRFVAGFIGRTNFLEGTLAGGEIGFAGFSLRADRFPEVAKLGRRVLFSVRPQSIALRRALGNGSGWWVEGRIVKRAYLGEHWDYLVAPGASGPPLRVAAPPADIFEIEDKVWLEIDPQRVAHINEAS
jgi:iron(III) transport system ATP-binding protein